MAILWSVWTLRNGSKFNGTKINWEETFDMVKIRVALWAKVNSNFGMFSVNDFLYNLDKVCQGVGGRL